MGAPERILYQFPISHYCEKTRWHLDAKGLAYEVRDVVPGVHVLVARWRGAERTVPLLVDRGAAVGDSTKIALHLESAYPTPALLPEGGAERARALELEEYFDTKAGTSVRQWLYGKLMQEKPGGAAEALFSYYGPAARLAGRLVGPLLEKGMRKMYRTGPEHLESARRALLEVADRLEQETGGDPSRYLVGDRLTLADITAASLLAPLAAPPESPYARMLVPLPAEVEALQRAFRERPAGQWVTARYRTDRRSTAGR